MVPTIVYMIAVAFLCDVVHGYSSGPPNTICSSMSPNHGSSAQTSTPPFTVTSSGSSFGQSETLTITLAASDGNSLRGFFIRARQSSSGDPKGTFTAGANQRTVDCTTEDSAISHNENSDKSSISVTWNAGNTTNDIIFYATVVRTQTMYWEMVESALIEYSSSSHSIASAVLIAFMAMMAFTTKML